MAHHSSDPAMSWNHDIVPAPSGETRSHPAESGVGIPSPDSARVAINHRLSGPARLPLSSRRR